MAITKKIPFQLGAEIVLRSDSNPAHRARTRIVGVRENEFIIIDTPVFAVSENISAVVEGTFSCIYLQEGTLYTFKSAFVREILGNIMMIKFPSTFEVEQLRKHPRIRVSLEASADFGDHTVSGRVRDISERGCLVELSRGSIFKGVKFSLSFTLPNDELVNGIHCTVMNTKFFHVRQITAVGVGFTAPPEELAKVKELCRFCLRFKV